MKSKSKIAKGKRMEEFVSKEVEAMGLGKSIRTPGSGSGNRFKGDLFNSLPFLLEIKNQDKYDINRWVDQAKRQAVQGNWDRDKWALVFRDFRSPEANPEIYAVIDFWQFLKLLKKDSAPRIKAPDQDMKWHLISLKDAINRVIKDLK